jgi:S1-C subfamily serine protease
MDDRFEAVFAVDAPAGEVWDAFERDDTREPARWWLPGFDSTGEEIEVDPGRFLRVRKDSFPCEGTEIAVTLQATETGTTVTVVQSGFGAIFDEMLESLEIGWSHIVADLALALQRGVRAGRHQRPWATLGCGLRTTAAGLEIVDIAPDSYADRAGLAVGDLLVTFGGAPIVTRRELETLMRVFEPGETVQGTVVRGHELLDADAVL